MFLVSRVPVAADGVLQAALHVKGCGAKATVELKEVGITALIDKLLWKKSSKPLNMPSMDDWKCWEPREALVAKRDAGGAIGKAGLFLDLLEQHRNPVLPTTISQNYVVTEKQKKVIASGQGKMIPNLA